MILIHEFEYPILTDAQLEDLVKYLNDAYRGLRIVTTEHIPRESAFNGAKVKLTIRCKEELTVQEAFDMGLHVAGCIRLAKT